MVPLQGHHDSAGASGFGRLLARLHADPDEAAHEYERLRLRLVKFFDWRGIASADECADEVLDRLARKLDGAFVEDVGKYAYGIARLIVLEQRRAPAFAPIDDVAPLTAVAVPSPGDPNELENCFDRCLANLPDDARALLLGYYEGERQAKISHRRSLAAGLGVTENALRSRVQRLRDQLERCVRQCTASAMSQPA